LVSQPLDGRKEGSKRRRVGVRLDHGQTRPRRRPACPAERKSLSEKTRSSRTAASRATSP
jgi:hypothetical protein